MIAWALIVVLSALALLHLYWGLGGLWPGHDPASLSARVAGWAAKKPPGFVACAAVAGALIAAARIVWWGQSAVETATVEGFLSPILYAGYAVMILVFGLRGLAAYLSPAFNYAKGTPFYTLNRRYYAPLCLLIAAGLIATFPPWWVVPG